MYRQLSSFVASIQSSLICFLNRLRVTLTRGLMRHVLRSQLIAPRISGLHAVRTFARRPSNFDEENAALEPKVSSLFNNIATGNFSTLIRMALMLPRMTKMIKKKFQSQKAEVSSVHVWFRLPNRHVFHFLLHFPCCCSDCSDPRPSVTQLRIAEMVRRILQRAVLTGLSNCFGHTMFTVHEVKFWLSCFVNLQVNLTLLCSICATWHLTLKMFTWAKTLGEPLSFGSFFFACERNRFTFHLFKIMLYVWYRNAMDLDTKMEAIEETIQRSVRILTYALLEL